jgi:hypothetical protein
MLEKHDMCGGRKAVQRADQASGKQAASFADIVSVWRLCNRKRVAYLIGIGK